MDRARVHSSTNKFTASDHIRTQVDAAVSQFYTQMNDVQVDLHAYEKIPNEQKVKKATATTKLQQSWDKAAASVQNLRELRDTLRNQESAAVYNYEMNDGVWKNGKAMQDVDEHISERQLRLDSARQLALQSEQQQRRQVKIKWLYVILFIVLLGAAVYMYMWAVGDEIGMHNVDSVDEAVRVADAPAEPSEPSEPVEPVETVESPPPPPPTQTPPSEATDPVPNQDTASNPSLTQRVGESLGLTPPADTPPSPPDKPPEPENVGGLFDSDSSQSESSSSSSDSASSRESESSDSLFS